MTRLMMEYLKISILTIILAQAWRCQGDSGCAAIFCPQYSTCVVTNGTASCQCFECDNSYNPICGSDGKTYPNVCSLQRAACAEKKVISVAHNGTCLTPCDSVHCEYYSLCEVINGSASCSCSFFCPLHYAPVCGSDGRTYSNGCQVRMESCELKKAISVMKDGVCDTSCASVRCGYYSICKVINGSATCVCDLACPKIYAPVCGSDGQTYSNECELQVESCRLQKDISVAKKGGCETPCATVRCGFYSICKVINGSATCVCNSACPEIYSPVCGSDGQTYSNQCELKAESCRMKKFVSVAREGNCDKDLCDRITCGFGGSCAVEEGLPQCLCPVCSAIYSPVCGDDGKTYNTDCEVTSQSCFQQRAISVAYRGKCGDPNHSAARLVIPATFGSIAFIGIIVIAALIYVKVYMVRRRTAKIHQFKTFTNDAKSFEQTA